MSSKPTRQAMPEHDAVEGSAENAEQALTPGAVLDHGRYRLLAKVGSDPRCDAELWRAKDGVLGRDVALTILTGDRSDSQSASSARRTLERAMHASTFNHVGVARVLDVVTPAPGDPDGVLGVVIAEWTHGTDLLDLVSEGPLPPGTAARLLQPLAAAVEAAHHAGLVLGADHPQRIRVTPEGEVRMAFPGPLSAASSTDDVRGLGAALYLLLTGRWALDGAPEGLALAPTGPDGTIVAPRTLRPTVPLELSTVALRALGSQDGNGTTGGVRTGAAVLRVLEQHATFDGPTSVVQQPPTSGDTHEVWSTQDPKPDKVKRKKLAISVGALAVATLLVIGWIAANLIGIFAGGDQAEGPSKTLGEPDQQARPVPVQVTGGTPIIKEQTPDSPDKIPNLYDGDPSTSWATDSYNDQFGSGFKSGTGTLLTLQRPTSVREVVIDSPSAGTVVEVRAANGPNPNVDASPLLGQQTLNAGQTTIPIAQGQPTQNLIVWVKQLAPSGGKYQSRINEITVQGSAS
ncbi:protein kinase family protein [Saccharopolyspora sp. SCSIO 74807]|uniref:protein kinase family protein n=1 Tax=Saccharopolyspora sp. SCSIO 74807 TaxID=3118084 RepID=UPI0030CD597F